MAVRRDLRPYFLLFFLSGFCGLLYQIVWMRKAFASFGIIAPVVSVVVSVFMLGLYVGAVAAGRGVDRISRRPGVRPIRLYAAAEILIGIGSVAVPWLFRMGEAVLLPISDSSSATYLVLSGLTIALSIFPWCVCMGATYPLVMAHLKGASETSFSFLYTANVLGAMVGTLLTAVVLIEALGFQRTLLAGMAVNFAVAGLALWLGRRAPGEAEGAGLSQDGSKPLVGRARDGAVGASPTLILFLTGFCSMGLEIVWTRAFVPVMGTLIYSFAFLLFTYLLATWAGSDAYRRHLKSGRVWSRERVLGLLAVTAFLPVPMNDPRIWFDSSGAMLSIFPLCFGLGYLTPGLIDEESRGEPERAGRLYAVNIAGSVLGPLFASYVILPYLGVRPAIILLSLPFIGLLIEAARATGRWPRQAPIAVAFAIVVSLTSSNYEEGFRDFIHAEVRRDHTATIISYGEGLTKRLLVNGVGITTLTPITKVMAHLPLALVPHPPTSALSICFGMGTTFRSLTSWGIDSTAVELVPSVKDAFGYYFADAAEVLARPHSRVVIDDGRRFLRRTTQMFDVITLDPPPPVQAAGSSLLYSEEFYSLAKDRLKPGGILQQWFLRERSEDIVRAAARSLANSFPHVRMFGSYTGWGYHFLASMTPITIPSDDELLGRFPEGARKDLAEWDPSGGSGFKPFIKDTLAQEKKIEDFLGAPDIRVTDDRPYNEYYLLRRTIGSIKEYWRGSRLSGD